MPRPQSTKIPAEFLCPITNQLMKEPMMSRYGYHYERSAILKQLDKGNHFCPVTGHPLRPSSLVSNKTLQWKIKYWAKANGIDRYAPENTDFVQDKSGIGFVAVPPSRFVCPLTQECMKDPVMTKAGVNFERRAILKWLDSAAEELCPVTHTPLYRRMLVSNSKLQWEIAQWHLRYGTVEIEGGGDETVSSITSHVTDKSLYSQTETSRSSVTMSLEYPSKFSGSEMVSRDMAVVSSLVRHLPTATVENHSKRMDKTDLLDALDNAISCSLRV